MSNKRKQDSLPAQVYLGTDQPPNFNDPKQRGKWITNKITRKVSKTSPLTPHWCAIRERLKGGEGTRQTLKASPVYQKHRLLQDQWIRGPACPVTICLTAAVFWPCEGSAITCPLIEDLYEWHHEGLAVSLSQSMKLISPCRSGDKDIRREDPMELKAPEQLTSNTPA